MLFKNESSLKMCKRNKTDLNSYRIADLEHTIGVQKCAIDTLKSELKVIKNQNRGFSNELKKCRERIIHLENKNRLQDDRQKPRVTNNADFTVRDAVAFVSTYLEPNELIKNAAKKSQANGRTLRINPLTVILSNILLKHL